MTPAPPRPLRIHVLSDLHLEFGAWGAGPNEGDPPAADLVLLAGDIHTKHRGIAWAANRWPDTPVCYIAGNHEFYGSDLLSESGHLRRHASKYPHVHFLDREVVDLPELGIRVAGATLWTDFDLFGEEHRGLCMGTASRYMNDFGSPSGAKGRIKKFTAERARFHHLRAAEWLEAEGERAVREGVPLVVMTHHAPIREGAGQRDPSYPVELNAAYCSDRVDLVEKVGAAMWVFGHTHISLDQQVGRTRVVSNARGYREVDDMNPDFKPDGVFELALSTEPPRPTRRL